MPGLPPFTQRKKTNRGYRLLSQRNPYSPSPASRTQHSIPPNKQTILSKWKTLKNLGPINHQQLALLVNVEENRKIALQFGGKDAIVVINAIDKALKQIEGPNKTRSNAFKVLRKLAGNTRQVPKSYLIGRWTRYTVKEEIIASGGFADVREGRLGDRVIAVRTIRVSQQTNIDDTHKAFCKESVLWMNVSHPNVLKLIAVDIKPNDMKFSMVSELMTNGNIVKYIGTREANRLRLLKGVANGLEHLHEIGIIHGDLKGANILIDNQTPPQACISDFGLCAIALGMTFDLTTHNGGGGTCGYMAPELYLEDGKRTKEADIYAFGMVVYEVITGSRPFRQHRWALPLPAASGSRPERPEDPIAGDFDQGTWEFIERCWDKNPQQRPMAKEASEHFERVAATSNVVAPSSIPPAPIADDESSLGPDSTRNFSRLFAQQSLSGSSRLQQTGFTARVFINPSIVRAPTLIPSTVQDKRKLLDRVRRKIMTLKLLPSSLRGDS